MKNLINDLKSGGIKRVYLLYGEERYLVRLYEGKIREKIADPAFAMMNESVFEGKEALPEDIENAANTLPFMCEKRLVILRGTGLFTTGSKERTERVATIVENAPETTLMLFVETDVDKRNKLYKKTAETGRCVEFKTPGDRELAEWVCRLVKKADKSMALSDAMFLLDTVERDMDAIDGEVLKLISYAGGREAVTSADVEQVCAKSLETRVFELVDAIGVRDARTALDIFNNMLVTKASPVMVITMIARQFRLILQARLWTESGLDQAQIAERTGMRGFMVGKCLGQGKRFSTPELIMAMEDCLEADINVKTGVMNDKLAVEVLIIKYAGGR